MSDAGTLSGAQLHDPAGKMRVPVGEAGAGLEPVEASGAIPAAAEDPLWGSVLHRIRA